MFSQFPDAVSWSRESANAVCNLSTADQRSDNAGSDDEGKDEAVDGVPGWSPADLGGARVGVVEEVEDQELRDQSILDREQDGRPGEGSGDDTDRVSWVALLAAELGPFKAPMNSTEEGDDLQSSQH